MEVLSWSVLSGEEVLGHSLPREFKSLAYTTVFTATSRSLKHDIQATAAASVVVILLFFFFETRFLCVTVSGFLELTL